MQTGGMVSRVRKEVEIHSRLKHPSILEVNTNDHITISRECFPLLKNMLVLVCSIEFYFFFFFFLI